MRYSVEKGTFPRVTHPSATDILLCPFDLHVLSLPPAFVLSQDQTLMLRIQSRLNHVFKLTRTSHLFSRRLAAPKTSVTSLDKRDRQSLFQSPGIPTRTVKLRRPRFSFFSICNCQITDLSHKTQSNPYQRDNRFPANHPCLSLQSLIETPERSNPSSPEAPPSSSVSGL